MKPVGDTDKKQGRFSVETSLKRQKYVVHGFEARALKHIPKLVFKICERLLKLSNSHYYTADMENFTKNFVAYKYDAKGQLISECLLGVIVFPKNQCKFWQSSALESKKWSNPQSKSTFL